MDEARAVVADFCEKNPSSARVPYAIAATPVDGAAGEPHAIDASWYSHAGISLSSGTAPRLS